MNYKYELVEINESIPAKIVEHKEYRKICVPKHWHKSLEMTYVLKDSSCEIVINGKINILKDDDIILINSGEIHNIEAQLIKPNDKVVGISVIIDYNFLKKVYPNFDDIIFILDDTKNEFKLLKDKFKEIIKIYELKDNNRYYYIKVTAIIYDIIYLLFKYFMKEKNTFSVIKTQKHIERFKKITQYINENYKNQLTLEEISNYFGLSKEHLSRNFKRYMDTTFKEYLTSIRLYNAHKELMSTDYSVLQIALENGFPDTRSFINKFKAVYGETPNKYRKNIIEKNFKQLKKL